MAKYVFFVDGFNLYHALDYVHTGPNHFRYRRFKWLNLPKLASLYVGRLDTLEKVILFTAFATWDPGKVARHKLFVRANENVGVEVVYGEFKRKDKHCHLCQRKYQTFEEKQADVNIALSLFRLAVTDQYDRAVIVSGDTDLIPAIKAVRATFPNKQIGVILPIAKSSEDLLNSSS
jgi:NYN domain